MTNPTDLIRADTLGPNSTDLDLIMRADTLGLQMDTYAEANIPLGSPFDATYREMEAEWQAIINQLIARGWTPDELDEQIHAPEG